MSDLIDDGSRGPVAGMNAPEFSVSELSGAVKRVIEGEFGRVRVRGELGRVSRPSSGHVYLELKDDAAVLSGVIWRGVAARLSTRPEEGLEVIATGKLTTFARQSRYQMVIESLEPAGIGALMAQLEKRKAALAAEGLFAAARKKPLPHLPRVIGVVTSPTGAVIRDILHRLRDRFPREVLIWPVAVQGDACAPEVARAIRGFNALPPSGGPVTRPDLIIVARGGGSVEDLWGFNDEQVVRAAAESRIPLISAVGHETDTTLIDLAADRRAPTPTAAAEIAVPVRQDLLAGLAALEDRHLRAMGQMLTQRGQRLRDLARSLPRAEDLVAARAQALDMTAGRLPGAVRVGLSRREVALARLAARLRPGAALEQAARRLESAGLRLGSAMDRSLRRRRDGLSIWRAAARAGALSRDLEGARRQLARRGDDLDRRMAEGLSRTRQRLGALARLHQTLGYRETLRRGYAVIRAGDRIVTHAQQAARHARLEVEFDDGRLSVAPDGAAKAGGSDADAAAGPSAGSAQAPQTRGRRSSGSGPRRGGSGGAGPEGQGSLF